MIISALLAMSALIDFSCPPSTLLALEPRLEAAFGTKVDVAAPLDSEVVVVHAEQVSAEVLRAKLAEVVCGKWEEQSDGRWVLSLDLEEERRRWDAARTRYSAAYDAYLKKVTPRWGEAARKPWDAKQFAIDLVTKEPNRLRYQFPADVIGMELQARVPGDDFARAALGETVIYSNVVIPESRPFPEGVDEVLRKHGSQGAELSRELAKFGWAETHERGYSWIALRTQTYYPWPDEPIWALMRLGVQEAYMGYGNLTLAQMSGQIHQRSISANEVSVLFEVDLEGLYPEMYESPYESMLPPAREWADEAGQSWLQKRVVASRLASEPLAAHFGDAWKAWSEAEKAPICINLPDQLAKLDSAPNSDYSPDTFGLLAGLDVEITKAEDGWITGTPWLPWKVRENRASRTTIQKFNRLLAKGEFPPLQDQLREKEWREYFWRGIGLIDLPAESHLGVYSWHARGELTATDEVLRDLSSNTLLRAVDGFTGTLADVPHSDYETIKDSIIKLFNWYRPADESLRENLNDSEPAIVFGRSQPSEFELRLYLDNQTLSVLVVTPPSDTVPAEFRLLSQESIAELSPEERSALVVLGEAKSCEINMTITHSSGYRARATLPIIEARW